MRKFYYAFVTDYRFGITANFETVQRNAYYRSGEQHKRFDNKDDAVQFLIERVGHEAVEGAGFLDPDCHYRIQSRSGYYGVRSEKACGVFATLQLVEDSFEGHNNVSIEQFNYWRDAASFAFGKEFTETEARKLKLNQLYPIKN